MSEPDTEAPRPRRGALRVVLDPSSPALTIAGIFLIAAGFLLIAVGWFEVSATVNVALQMPYLVSAAVTGLALIVIGVTFVGVAAKQQDADRRIRTLDRLEKVLSDLGSPVDSPDGPHSGGGPGSFVQDSAFRAAIVFAALAVAGLVAVVLAWIGVSGTLNVGTQVAYAASGGIGGLALVICGVGLLFAHLGRWAAAREDASLERVVEAASHIDDVVRSTDGSRRGRRARRGKQGSARK